MADTGRSLWTATEVQLPSAVTVGDLLRRTARAAPGRTALVFVASDHESRSFTYAELLHLAERSATNLLEWFRPGERIAIWAANRAEWILVQLGAALAGLVLVPMNPELTVREAIHIIVDSGAAGLVHDSTHRGADLALRASKVQAACPELREAICFEDWEDTLGRAIEPGVLSSVNPASVAMVQYTSGTTGVPKGAVLRHGAMTVGPIVLGRELDLGVAPVWLNVMPMFHIGGCGPSTIAPISLEGTHVLMERYEPQRVLEAISEHQVTFFGGVPAMILDLMERFDPIRDDAATLRTVMSGGTAVPAALVRTIESTFGVRYVGSYGQTETHGNTSLSRPSDSDIDKAETVGRALPHMSVKIVDAQGGVAPVGHSGELCAMGPTLMDGYLNQPDATAAAFDDDRWLRSGDLCSMDDRGYIRYRGRVTEMILRGGENIYPREIEDMLSSDATIAEVAVVGVPDHRLGEEIAAYIRPAAGSAGVLDAAAALAEENLARFKQPRLWYLVSGFPRTTSGKIAKFRLVEAWQNNSSLLSAGDGVQAGAWDLEGSLLERRER